MKRPRLNGIPSFQKPHYYPRLGQAKSLVNDLDSTMARRPAPAAPAPPPMPTPAPVAPPPIIATPVIPSVTTDNYGLRSQPYQKSDPISRYVTSPKVVSSIPSPTYSPVTPTPLTKSYSPMVSVTTPTVSLPASYGPLTKSYTQAPPVTNTVSISYNPTAPAANTAFNAALNQGISYKAPLPANTINVSYTPTAPVSNTAFNTALNQGVSYKAPLPVTPTSYATSALNKGISYNVPISNLTTTSYSSAPKPAAALMVQNQALQNQTAALQTKAAALMHGLGEMSANNRNLLLLGLVGAAIYFLRNKK